MTEDNRLKDTSRRSSFDRYRYAAIAILWALVIGLLVYWWSSPRMGVGVATVLSALAIFTATLFTVLDFVLLSDADREQRRWVAITCVTLLALPIALLRLEGFNGAMVPRFAWRWSPSRTLELEKSQSGKMKADLGTATPDDYPEFLGPGRRLTVDKIRFDTDWSDSPPRLVWRKPVGDAWSAFATANGFAVTQEQRADQECVTCYRIADGQLMWASSINARHETVLGRVGPRATPTINEGRVYAQGATGILRCLDGSTGEPLWERDLTALGKLEHDRTIISWGRAASPLVVDDRVIVPLGGDASLICFAKTTGEELWRGGNRSISYSSPVVANIGGLKQILVVLEEHLCGHDLATGKELWSFEWPGDSKAEANNSNPIAVDDQRIFVSKGYGQGSAMVRVACDQQGQWSAQLDWDAPTRMKTKMTNCVMRNGYVFGLDDTILQCLDVDTGQSMWKRGRYGYGQILQAGDVLIVVAEDGAVVAVDATPDSATVLGEFQAIDGDTWNSPALHGRYLLIRNTTEAACFELNDWARID